MEKEEKRRKQTQFEHHNIQNKESSNALKHFLSFFLFKNVVQREQSMYERRKARENELKKKMIGQFFFILFHSEHMRIQIQTRIDCKKKGTKKPLRNYHTNVKNKSNIAFATL